ncbi:MAG: hypothetical protein QOH69_790 [Actinomycetota bacterium]|jgi:hypothetical protein|nr:hypothetical protein [Actinomycetota bacterium]
MLLAILVGVTVLATTMSAPALAAVTLASNDGVTASAPPPGLSITLSDARGQTQSGATLTYTATVFNAGAVPVRGRLDVTIPSYAAFVGTAASDHKGADVSWPIAVDAGKSASRKVTVKLGTIPKSEVRFTTIATLYPAGSGTQILVRTADPDAIRGVVDPAHTVGLQPSTTNHSNEADVLLIPILGAVVIGAVVLLVWIRRRRVARGNSE